VFYLRCAKQRHRRQRDRAGLLGRETGDHVLRPVREPDEHPIARRDAEIPEGVAETVGALSQLRVGQFLVLEVDRYVLAPTVRDVTIGQLDGGVDLLRVVKFGKRMNQVRL
jgi:hypothetical protein